MLTTTAIAPQLPPRLWIGLRSFVATSRSSRRPVQVAAIVEEANEEERRRDVIEESENEAGTRRTGRSSRLSSLTKSFRSFCL